MAVDGWLVFLVGCWWLFVGCFFWELGFGLSACFFGGEFDPGSGRTLAACLTHASRTRILGAFVLGG